MNKRGKHSIAALTASVLILSALLSFPVLAAEAESESDALIPQTEADLSAPRPLSLEVPETGETTSGQETTKEPVVVEPPVSNPPPLTQEEPSQPDDDSGFWDSVLEFFSSVGEFLDDFWDDFTDGIWDGFPSMVADWADIGGGKLGLLNTLVDGGARYASEELNDLIDGLYEVFYVPGIVVMMICFCYAVFKGCYSMELGDKNSIVKPIIGMIIVLFAYSMAKEVLTAFFQISMQLTQSIGQLALDYKIALVGIAQPGEGVIGYDIITFIVQFILLVNIAKIALMQSTAPLFLGFAAAENSRRVFWSFVKEYAKCCLIPPITIAYAVIVMQICDDTWQLLGSIVIGISIWSMGRKFLDKILG